MAIPVDKKLYNAQTKANGNYPTNAVEFEKRQKEFTDMFNRVVKYPEVKDIGIKTDKEFIFNMNKVFNSKTSHIALCDNTPYLPESGKLIKELVPRGFNIGSIWYPFNGAAQDYPLCYDNLSLQEKKSIVKSRFDKRNKCIINSLTKKYI